MNSELYNIIGNTDEMTREQWLQARMVGIGGSDLAGVAGLSKWASPLSVYLNKTGQSAPTEENEAMYWGNVLEDVVAGEFAKRTGKTVSRFPYLMQSKQYQFMLANIDRAVTDYKTGEIAGLECKTAGASMLKEWEDNKVPEAYMLQCYHYMVVTGLKKWYVAVLIGGNNFQIRELEWDQDVVDHVIKIEADFWKLVEDRTPPAAGAADVDLMSCLYQGNDANTLYLDDNGAVLVHQYIAASQAEKAAKAAKDEAKALLCDIMKEHIKATTGQHTVSWTPYTTTSLDTDRLKKELADVSAIYTKTISSRRFSIR